MQVMLQRASDSTYVQQHFSEGLYLSISLLGNSQKFYFRNVSSQENKTGQWVETITCSLMIIPTSIVPDYRPTDFREPKNNIEILCEKKEICVRKKKHVNMLDCECSMYNFIPTGQKS